MKIDKLFILFLLICLLLVSCAGSPTENDTNTSADETYEQADSHAESEDNNTSHEPNYTVTLTTNVSKEERYIPSSKSAEDITDEECRIMTEDVIGEILDIAVEFYGNPNYLLPTHNTLDSTVYSEVMLCIYPQPSVLTFENDADALRELLNVYLSERLIADKFSLEYPCPIYEGEDGKLYRAVIWNTLTGRAPDIAAGRIFSRENGVVRYGFPLYGFGSSTGEIFDDFFDFGFIDFVFENNVWKVDNFHISNLYSYDRLISTSIRMDDFFIFERSLSEGGATATVKDGKTATCTINGKEHSFELNKNCGGIKSIEKTDENIFITYRGLYYKNETFVFDTSGELVSRFTADDYVLLENGDWYYVDIDRVAREGDIFDMNGEKLTKFVAPYDENDLVRTPIPTVKDFTYDEKNGFTVVYDNMDK